jgi:hypothetical protein
MRKLVTPLLVTVFAAAWIAAGHTQQATPEAPKGTGIIIGRVVDAATDRAVGEVIVSMNVRPAAPLPGARGVTPGARGAAPAGRGAPAAGVPRGGGARGGAVPQQRVLTGGDGRFVFYDLPAGTYTLVASLPGYMDAIIGQMRPAGPGRPLQLEDGGRVTDARIRMWRLG